LAGKEQKMVLEARARALIPGEYHHLVLCASLALQDYWIKTGEIELSHSGDWTVRRDTVFSPPFDYTELMAEGVKILDQFRRNGQMPEEKTEKAFLVGFVISRREAAKRLRF
jgi:hypothetical protein